MEELRKLFSFSKGERIAVFTMLALIAILMVLCLVRPMRYTPPETAFHNLDSLLQLHETAMKELQEKQLIAENETNELHPFPFNPNTLTEDEWRQIGLTDRQIRNIMNYQAKGGKFYSKKDLGKLYTISEADFEQLEPFIVLPELSQNIKTVAKDVKRKADAEETPAAKPAPKPIPVVDLNAVDSATLVELPQIGSYTAGRIVAYREKLGGFISLEQLREVKGMDSARFQTISPYIRLENVEIRKLDINRADFKALVSHPYLSYNQVKAIVNHREKKGMVKNWTQLQTVVGEKEPINPLIETYLKY